MRVKFLFAWYDLWIGAYWDRKGRRLYILPLPCLGIVIQFAVNTALDPDSIPSRAGGLLHRCVRS